MTIQKLAGMIAKIEGKKSQTHVGNIQEILKILVSLEVSNPGEGPISALVEMVEAKKAKKTKKALKK